MFKAKLFISIIITAMLYSTLAAAENSLSLEQAYQRVLSNNPAIKSSHAMVLAAEGKRIQQSLLPNPEVVFEVENFGGDSPRTGFETTEYTLGVEQKFEIAGKRSKRETVASFEKQKVSQEALARIQSILAQTKSAYVRLAVAKERLSLANKRNDLVNKIHATVKRRINAAKAPEIQHTKADIEVAAAEMEQRKALQELSIAKVSLANLMSLPALEQDIEFNLNNLPEISSLETVTTAIQESPMSVIGHLSVMREKSSLKLAKANGFADPTIQIGIRRFNEDDSTAFLASLSIPINIFDRNQGRIKEVKSNLLTAEADQQYQYFNLTKQATELWQTLVSTKEEVQTYQNELIPSAKKSLAQAEDGFNRGAFNFIDLLDAQRTLFEIQTRRLEALYKLHETKAWIDVLTGGYSQITLATLNSNKLEKE